MFGGSVPERFEGMVPERCSEEESRKDVWRKSAGKMFGGIVPERCLEEGCRKDVWRKSAGDMFGGSFRKARLECGQLHVPGESDFFLFFFFKSELIFSS